MEQLMVQSPMAWVCMAASSTRTLVFIDDVAQDRSSRTDSEEFRDILCLTDWAVFHNKNGQ